jgi:hypothetical protein
MDKTAESRQCPGLGRPTSVKDNVPESEPAKRYAGPGHPAHAHDLTYIQYVCFFEDVAFLSREVGRWR